jgi:hypothetical protein
MTKTLFLFLFSDNPDAYVNAITYAYDVMDVQAVKFIYIGGTKIGAKGTTQASSEFNNVWHRLQDLSVVADIYKQMDNRLLDRQLIPVDYAVLKSDLERLIKLSGGAPNCIIDLTGMPKGASIDVFTVCFALGIKSIYTFELKKRFDPKMPDQSLYHSLTDDSYSYTCLTSTPAVQASQASLLRKSHLLWYVGGLALIVMLASLYILVSIGPNSSFVQYLNLAAAVVGLASPGLALLEQRRKS